MDLFRGKHRLLIYVLTLTVLLTLLALALRSISGTGAFLTNEGDWQGLAGNYHIGTIDYTVSINGQPLLGMGSDNVVQTHRMAVPLRAGVRMFDATVASSDIRVREFNEGVTLMRVRIVNRSDGMVDVNAVFSMIAHDAPAGGAIRFLPLPTELTSSTAQNFNHYQYVLTTLGIGGDVPTGTAQQEADALKVLDDAYIAYREENPVAPLPVGIIPGASAHPGDDNAHAKDVYLLLWSEYGAGEYNTPGATTATTRRAEFEGKFTVGQLE